MIGRRSFTYRLFFSPLLIVSLGSSAQYQSFKNYTPNDGIPSKMIYQSFQDDEGYIWLATEYGVSKYDGYHFDNYTMKSGLSDNEVLEFFKDDLGRTWLLTLNGKFAYHYQGKFYNSETDSTLRPLDAQSMITSAQKSPNGDIWFSTYNGELMRYDREKKVTKIFSGRFKTINKIIFLNDTKFLLLSRVGIYLVQIIDNLPPSQWVIQQVPFHRKNLSFFLKTQQLSDTSVLFTLRDKVYEYDITTNQIELLFQTPNRVLINNICLSGSRNLWICTTKGLIKYDLLVKKSYPVGGSLSDQNISHVLIDNEGNYWISTLENGLYFSTNIQILNYGEHSSLKIGPVNSLAVDDNGKIVMGMGDGTVMLLNDQNFEKWNFDYHYNYQPAVKKVVCSKDRYVICTSESFFVRRDNVKMVLLGAKDLVEHPTGDYWIASSNGIYRFYPEDFDHTNIDFNKRKLSSVRSNKIFLDNAGQVLVATDNDLLCISNLNSHSPEFKSLNLGFRVSDFCHLPDGTMLFATKGEGLFIKNKQGSTRMTIKDGLPSDYCKALYLEDDVIWLGTMKGISRIEYLGSNPQISTFNIEDGLNANEVNDILVLNDTVWVATEKGLSFFSKDLMKKESKPIDLYFSKIQVNEKMIDFKQTDELICEYDQNNIRIDYVGLCFKNRGNIFYRYRLSETSDWQLTKNTSLEFSALASGNYTFMVQAKSENGVWGKSENFRFVIKEVFWKSWVFQLLVAFVFGALVWFTFQVYLKRKQRKQQLEYKLSLSELKALRAQINPHFMFNALNSIQLFLKKNKNDEATSYLNKFARLMRLILSHSSKTDISIKEEVEALTYYLELERLRSENKFDFSIKIDARIDEYNTEIPAMVLQPFVENAIWHGLAPKPDQGSLQILFEKQDQKVIISIIDDGIGRSKSRQINKTKKDSKGIKLIEERIQLLNKSKVEKISLLIKDLSVKGGSGTKVIVTVPE